MSLPLIDGRITECAPHVAQETGGEVCSPPDIIKRMNSIIKEKNPKFNSNDPLAILEELKKLLGCNTEACVLTKIKAPAIIKTHLKPEGPTDTSLLNNFNIDQCLAQYTKKYPNFCHIPFQMIDFGTQWNNPLYNLDPINRKGKDCFGCVLNTDVSSGSGKHWFCLFIDLRGSAATIEFFNSSGNMPVQEVHEYMIVLQKRIEKNRECRIEIVSSIQIQKSRTECGPYSLYYIISRVEGIPLDTIRTIIKTRGIPDDKMTEFRKYCFRGDF